MLSPFAERQMIEKSMNTGYDISEKRVLPDRRRSALKIMGSLIGLVKPLIHIMILAVLLGTAGYLCAIFLTILAGQILIQGLGHVAGTQGAMSQGLFAGMTPQNLFVLMIVLAVAVESFIMRNSTAIILLHLSCWQLSVIKYLRHCEGFVRQSLKDGIREI